MKLFLVALLFIVSVNANATGKRIGNGGDALVCYDEQDKITFVELYDYYEGRTRRGFDLALGSDNLNYKQKLNLLIARVERHNPTRAKIYREWSEKIVKDTLFVSNVSLNDVQDTGDGWFVPKDCKIEQIAVQLIPRFLHLKGENRYVIDQDLWDLMDEDSKAGLLFHELVYRGAIEFAGHTNSVATRVYTALMSSSLGIDISLDDYISLLVSLDFFLHF